MCIRFNTNQEKNQVRGTILLEHKDLSVLKIGAPDCPVCHRTVSGAPGPYNSESATLGNFRVRSAIIHRTVQCATGLSGEPRSNGSVRANGQFYQVNSATQYHAEVRAAKSEGTGLSGAARRQSPMIDQLRTLTFG
jgi:hypothetical protein